jgi:hypothetical protein
MAHLGDDAREDGLDLGRSPAGASTMRTDQLVPIVSPPSVATGAPSRRR